MRFEDIEQYEETQQGLYLAVIGIELLLLDYSRGIFGRQFAPLFSFQTSSF